MEQPPERVDGDPGPDGDQHDAERHRGDGLDPLVSVGMIGIGLGAGEPRREEDEHVGYEVRERVHAVGDERLGLREEPSRDLRKAEDEIDGRPDEGDPADDRVALGRGVAEPRGPRPPGAGRLRRIGHRRRPVSLRP